jgi:hypothetical protein
LKRFLLDPTAQAGDRYSPVFITPDTIAQRASCARTLKTVEGLCRKLAHDPYTEYMAKFYNCGMQVAGDDWRFMDLISVLYAVAEMGSPENYLEIGVRRGRSACMVAAACPRTSIHAFDMWQHGYANNENPGPEFVRSELAKFGHSGEITFVNGDSHKTVPEFLTANPELMFDLITVDGDHSVRGAWGDLTTVIPRLRVGGVIVFDDIANPYCPGLDQVWNDFLRLDIGLAGFSFTAAGTGVGFAVRKYKSKLDDKHSRWRLFNRL